MAPFVEAGGGFDSKREFDVAVAFVAPRWMKDGDD
jgi:hypothetical protein